MRTATLPTPYVFQASDQGVRQFGLVLRTVGTQTITVQDANQALQSAQVTQQVLSTAIYFQLSLSPNTATAGRPVTMFLQVYNADGSANTSYANTVHVTSSDPSAQLPSDTAASGGVAILSNLVFHTAGNQTVTVTDTSTTSLNVTNAVTVLPGTPASRAPQRCQRRRGWQHHRGDRASSRWIQ